MKRFVSIALFAASLSVLTAACFTNPVTGRKSLNLVNESEMRQLGTTQYTSFLASNPAVTGTNANADMVKRIGNRMAAAVNEYLKMKGQQSLISGYQWEFNLVNNNQVNAWCMPGGKVVVYTGILPVTQTETGLAVVMGHEIAHAVARHGNERMSQGLVAQFGGEALSAALSSKPAQTQNLFNSIYGIGAQGGLLAYSRSQETEADEMGLYFMALAGYDPNEAVNFWSRMAAQSGQKPMELLSTHPADSRRVSDIKGWLPRAMQYYKPR